MSGNWLRLRGRFGICGSNLATALHEIDRAVERPGTPKTAVDTVSYGKSAFLWRGSHSPDLTITRFQLDFSWREP